MESFNPPCGCVAFSTLEQRGDPLLPDVFQSALRMRGLFNMNEASRSENIASKFQSALRMRGLFNVARGTLCPATTLVSIRLADAWPFQPRLTAAGITADRVFQSALRMRGLFN